MSVKPTLSEEEFFLKTEAELRKKIASEKERDLKSKEKEDLKKLHYMHCPKCGMGLVEIEYKSIKIDECSGCRGIWLDQNELEQVVKLEQGTLKRLAKIFKG